VSGRKKGRNAFGAFNLSGYPGTSHVAAGIAIVAAAQTLGLSTPLSGAYTPGCLVSFQPSIKAEGVRPLVESRGARLL